MTDFRYCSMSAVHKVNENMYRRLVSVSVQWITTLCFCFCFLLTIRVCAAGANSTQLTGEIPMGCGSSRTSSAAVDGRAWLADNYRNSSTRSSILGHQLNKDVDPVHCRTAQIHRSEFSYVFQAHIGQKLIPLHFLPMAYNGFNRSKDLFTVKTGQKLSNFSASITAVAENQSLNIIFFPTHDQSGQSQIIHAFRNGIELISVPETRSYCQARDIGVKVVGMESLAYIDNNTAFVMVRRRNITQGLSSWSGYDCHGILALNSKTNKVNRNITWRISVDVGFRYFLVRFHLRELGYEIAESGNFKGYSLLANDTILSNKADDVHRKMKIGLGQCCRNCMVRAKSPKREAKYGNLISLQMKGEFINGHGPLEGFKTFKLSNEDNSLACPNPLPPPTKLNFLLWTIQYCLSLIGLKYTTSTAFVIIVCLVNIIVHMLRQTWEAYFPKEDFEPSTRATRLCRHFSLAEMQSATKNFNKAFVIGKGGFGEVYKGFINSGRETVAIKRLRPNSKQGKREFWTEIETLSDLRHFNLVSLIGYCNEQQEMILVYEYMPNGTLADHIYKHARKNRSYSSLSWEERLKICIGAGRGLDYLHTGQGVIHRDIKASNILLDETFVSKVSDFGLAKTENLRFVQSQDSTDLKGTFGYVDPDYFRTRKLTAKSDTYSFGVVLLEVLCGRPALDPRLEEDERSLTMWARGSISRGKLDQIVAPSLREEISPSSLMAFMGIVEGCLHDEPKKRPTIARVVIDLELALEQQNTKSLAPMEITRPVLSISTEPLAKNLSSVRNTTSSLREQTDSRKFHAEPKYGNRNVRNLKMHKLTRIWPWNTAWKKVHRSKKIDTDGDSKPEPISKQTSKNFCKILKYCS